MRKRATPGAANKIYSDAVAELEVVMGLTYLEVEVAGPATPDNTEPVEFLVDSGAVHSVVPALILERLGIEALDKQEFRLADGTKVVRRKGGAVFRYGERVGVADVIFGEGGDSNLMGATTLESLGLVLDPLKRELRPLPMVL
ncbi:MAG: aspartyl protease family protein [Gammaproteobacteria bacterium]|nr:aspartyl protease family protein [Gammaproteobacteria bacterium]MDE0444405.1 aspartyl protease family protein [Gammaproteobacteria bacterium]